jgi:hypothetical protein
MRLRVMRSHIKFKTGPAGTSETKQKVADRLRESGRAGDIRAAEVIEASLQERRRA